MDGAVERELQDGETAIERFRMRAVLLPPVTAPGASPSNAQQRAVDMPLRATARRSP
jgi:hypothetical protein